MKRSRASVALTLSGFLASFLLPAAAFAFGPMLLVCSGLPDCGRPPANALVSAVVTTFAVLMALASGLTLLWIVVCGIQMLVAFGDESKVSKAKYGIMYALLGLGLALASGTLVSFVGTQVYGASGALPLDFLISVIASLITIAVIVFNALFGFAVIVGAIRMVMSAGKQDEYQKGSSIIQWAIIGALVVNVSKALVQAFLTINL